MPGRRRLAGGGGLTRSPRFCAGSGGGIASGSLPAVSLAGADHRRRPPEEQQRLQAAMQDTGRRLGLEEASDPTIGELGTALRQDFSRAGADSRTPRNDWK